MDYIVLDLEFNKSNRRYVSNNNGINLYSEIVQIGAVKLDSNRIEKGTFSSLIRPVAYTKMNTEVSRLTGITTEMLYESGRGFKDVIKEFVAWCGSDYCFITWSGTDAVVLGDNILYHGLDISLPCCYDIQLLFDLEVSDNDRDMSLAYAMWKLDIDPLVAHDALNDARNTAEVFRRMDISHLSECIVE